MMPDLQLGRADHAAVFARWWVQQLPGEPSSVSPSQGVHGHVGLPVCPSTHLVGDPQWGTCGQRLLCQLSLDLQEQIC